MANYLNVTDARCKQTYIQGCLANILGTVCNKLLFGRAVQESICVADFGHCMYTNDHMLAKNRHSNGSWVNQKQNSRRMHGGSCYDGDGGAGDGYHYHDHDNNEYYYH